MEEEGGSGGAVLSLMWSANGSKHLFGCSCALCECVSQTLYLVLKERPELRGLGVIFDPVGKQQIEPPSNRTADILICTTKANDDAPLPHDENNDKVAFVRSCCGCMAADPLRTWIKGHTKLQCRSRSGSGASSGGVTLELPDPNRSYCCGANVCRTNRSKRFFHVTNTISAIVRIERLRPSGKRLYVFEGLAEGCNNKSAMTATSKTLLDKLKVSVARKCVHYEEGDVLWSSSTSSTPDEKGAKIIIRQGPDGKTILSVNNGVELEISIPVTHEILRAFDPRMDDSVTVDAAMKMILIVAKYADLSKWNILSGLPNESSYQWHVAFRMTSPPPPLSHIASYPGSSILASASS